LPALRHGLLEAFVSGWRELGDIVLYRVPRPMIVFAHPDEVQHFFHDHHDHHPRSWLVRERLKDIMGEGLFANDDEAYHRDLRVLLPALEQRRVADLERITHQTTEEMLARWDARSAHEEPLDVHAEMQRLNLDVMGRILLGDTWDGVGERMRPALTKVYDYLIPRVTGFPTPLEPLFPWHRRYRRALATVDSVLYSAIEERRREPRNDLLSLFLEAEDSETGSRMSDREARYQLTTMIFGFYKSIGNVLGWTWYLLSHNPDARKRLTAELAEQLGGRDASIDDLSRLPYLDMMLKEVLRLYPPLYIIARPPKEDEVIGGYRIPSDMFCLFLPYITHRHGDFWENPEGFEPERFSPERSAGRHPFAYFPFATGPRKCPGEDFGLTELKLVVAKIAQRHSLELVPGHEIRRRGAEFLLRPINGLPMRIGEDGVVGTDAQGVPA
jgi:cytochrome P450